MKKLVSGLMAFALIFALLPLEGTVAFLTSEKKQTVPVSLGTNEDVFTTETEAIRLVTEVEKHVTITRVKTEAGKSTEERNVDISIDEGTFTLVFKPQRPHLDLDVENLKVTGEPEGRLEISREGGGNGIEFRIGHIRDQVKREHETLEGELHITALGGFYRHVIPLTVVTEYKESSSVVEVSPPPPPAKPGPGTGTPGSPPPGTETPVPPPPGAGGEAPKPPGAGGEIPQPPDTGEEPQSPSTGEKTPQPPGGEGEDQPPPSPGEDNTPPSNQDGESLPASTG
ncbi:hypothetical protein HT747_14040 [Brevibacillus borstelensis]|uniref:hypothetical protein n=1 Tax=Brevibacillus borstelensis TaxID=45462 RepID=UPI00156201E6|nr:hypothetical protein [Brevibacillus borstelensis]MBE5396262.1 hypothetical protein [Brevibacillus borstelensis]